MYGYRMGGLCCMWGWGDYGEEGEKIVIKGGVKLSFIAKGL